MQNEPFWALAHCNEARQDLALVVMHSFAQRKLDEGTAFDGEWQDEICHLNSFLIEFEDSPTYFPGTQLHVRGLEDEIEPVFVMDSELGSPTINALHTDGRIEQIADPYEGGWEEAGQ